MIKNTSLQMDHTTQLYLNDYSQRSVEKLTVEFPFTCYTIQHPHLVFNEIKMTSVVNEDKAL